MTITVSSLKRAVAPVVHALLPTEAGLDVEAVAELFTTPPDPELGDLAFPCFRLAKATRQPPPKLAATLAAALDTSTGIVEQAVAAGPYVNLRLRLGPAAAVVLPLLARGVPEPRPTRAERVMVEYSQPNTHKAFHVGHMRNLSLGDAIVRLLRADGYDVVAANYYGDLGAHIPKCLWWYLDRLSDAERVPPEHGRGEWLGQLYAAASNQLADWQDAAEAGDARARAELERARARTTEILQKLEHKDPEMRAVWEVTREWSLEDFDEIYAWSGVKFDRVFYESELDDLAHAIVQEYLDRGVFVESDGAVGIYNEEVKHMPFFMLRKRDGTTLYSTKDLALARLKFEEHDIDRSIYVVDSRQSDHFRHVFLTLAKMGFGQAARCQHVPYEMVELPSGPMATRRGNAVLFQALREGMLSHLALAYLEKYRGQWPDEEIETTAHVLALGAIKYGMLSRDVNQKIVFDLEAWLKLEGDTGPYIQYAAARIGSILRKAGEAGKGIEAGTFEDPAGVLAALEQPEERELVLALDGLFVVLHQAAQQLRPSLVCTYLHGLAKSVHRFANAKNCSVIHSEGALLQARLVLVAAAREALRYGALRLGIPIPERM